MAENVGTIGAIIRVSGRLSTDGDPDNTESEDAYTDPQSGGEGSGGGSGGSDGSGGSGGTPGGSEGQNNAGGSSCAAKYGIGLDEAAATNREGVAHPFGTSPDGLARERAWRAAGGGGEAANPIDEGTNNAQAVPASCRDIPVGAPDSYKVGKHFTVAQLTQCPAGQHSIGNGLTTLDPTQGYRSRGYSREEIICNLRHLATNALDPIWDHFTALGYRIVVSSGFRRGVAKSDHTKGSAADLIFYHGGQRLNGSALCRVMKAIDQVVKVPYTQMIFESPGSNGDIIHIACRKAGGNSSMRLCWSPDNGHGARMTSGYKYNVSLEGSPPVRKT